MHTGITTSKSWNFIICIRALAMWNIRLNDRFDTQNLIKNKKLNLYHTFYFIFHFLKSRLHLICIICMVIWNLIPFFKHYDESHCDPTEKTREKKKNQSIRKFCLDIELVKTTNDQSVESPRNRFIINDSNIKEVSRKKMKHILIKKKIRRRNDIISIFLYWNLRKVKHSTN